MKQILSAVLLLAVCGVAMADCKVTATYAAPTHAVQAQAAKKDDVFFSRFLAVQLLDIPTYSAVYVPAPTVAQPTYSAPAQSSQELREVLEVLKSFDARLKRLEGGPVVPLVPPVTVPPMSRATSSASEILAAKCAVCHESAIAGDKAGGIVLFKGTELSAGERWRLKMADAITMGRMPEMGSGVTMTADEKAVAINYLKGLK